MQKYYISQWALFRRAELIELPEDFEIHPDYLRLLDKEKIISAVKNMRRIFADVYQDMADYPDRFKLPMIEIIDSERTKMGAPPAKALSSKWAPYRLFDVLINLLISGDIEGGALVIDDPQRLAEANKTQKMTRLTDHKLQNIPALYSQLDRYGLFLEGLKDYKIAKDTVRITLSYPDDPDFLTVLKWMADKAQAFDRRREFMMCQYRLLSGGVDSINYGFGADYIADRLHTSAEQDCVYALDAALAGRGYVTHIDGAGYTTESGYDSLFYYEDAREVGNLDKSNIRVRADQHLYLRIRAKNIQKGAEHIKKCSDELKSVFIPGDQGCENRGACTKQKLGGGQAYEIDGVEYWKCGCHGGKFVTFQPRSEDIADYIELAGLFNR